jgi:hypothetical protein
MVAADWAAFVPRMLFCPSPSGFAPARWALFAHDAPASFFRSALESSNPDAQSFSRQGEKRKVKNHHKSVSHTLSLR